MGQIGLFDIENKLSALSKMGDPLEKPDRAINWKSFRPVIDKAFRKERKSNAGRPPFDHVMMFKVLLLQQMSVCTGCRPCAKEQCRCRPRRRQCIAE